MKSILVLIGLTLGTTVFVAMTYFKGVTLTGGATDATGHFTDNQVLGGCLRSTSAGAAPGLQSCGTT